MNTETPVVSAYIELPPLTEPPGTGIETSLFQSMTHRKVKGPNENCIKRSETMPSKNIDLKRV